MVPLQKIFLLGSRCMLEDGGQSTACLRDLPSKDQLPLTFQIVWTKCFVGLWDLLKFFSAGIALYGMAMEDDWNFWRDLHTSTPQSTHLLQFLFFYTVCCLRSVYSLESSSSLRYSTFSVGLCLFCFITPQLLFLRLERPISYQSLSYAVY